MHLKTILFIFFFILFHIFNAQEVEDAVVLRAVRGLDARLPCGQRKIFLDGANSYVLWLKNDKDFLYRFPNERFEKRAGRRDRLYGTPCDTGYCQDDTWLLIKKASDRDAGLYRCRVHYQASPSVDYLIELKLVNSTDLPKIYSGEGELLNKGFVGPLSLNSNLKLICEIEDSDPETELYWRRNGALVDRTFTSRPGCTLRVEVHLFNISRGEMNAQYECLAQNADVSEPLVASVVLKMFLAPMSVEIRMNNNYDFEAGQPRVVDCVVVGCVPPPAITWHLGSTMVRPSVHKELHDGNYTVSSLSLAPSLRDHRKELVCRAYNALMPDELFQDVVTINVGYRPICDLSLEERVGAVVGEAETVRCVVESSPAPLQFTWTFADSKTLYTSFTKVAGHHHKYSSSLTWLSRDGDLGILNCRATNEFGEMKKPCTYNISVGGPPELPECEITRIYPNSLRVQCGKAWDGGRKSMMHLDIVDEEGTVLKNATDEAGHFYLPNINDSQNMTAVLYVTNSRGRSRHRAIYLHSLIPVSEAEHNYVQASWMPYLEGVAGVVAIGIFVFSVTLGVKILNARNHTSDLNPDLIATTDGLFQREPELFRDVLAGQGTCITVNTVTGCQNTYSGSPQPACRVLVGHGTHTSPEACPSSLHSYYV